MINRFHVFSDKDTNGTQLHKICHGIRIPLFVDKIEYQVVSIHEELANTTPGD